MTRIPLDATTSFQHQLLSSPLGTSMLVYTDVPYKQEGSYAQRARLVASRLLCEVTTQFDKQSSSLFATKLSGPLIAASDINDVLILMLHKEARARNKGKTNKSIEIIKQIKQGTLPTPAEHTAQQSLDDELLGYRDRMLQGEHFTHSLPPDKAGRLRDLMRAAGYGVIWDNYVVDHNPDNTFTMYIAGAPHNARR